jgi:capsid protein
MATAPILFDQFGREARLNSSFYPSIWPDRTRRNVPTILGDSDRTSNTAQNRKQTLMVARQLVANHGIVRGPIRDMTTYAVGSGLTPQSQVGDHRVARVLEDYFTEYWAPQADFSGRHHFNVLQQLASWAIDVDGDVGFHMYAPGASDIGQLQMIEGHRIGNSPLGPQGWNADVPIDGWRDGVKIDPWGRTLAYAIHDGDWDSATQLSKPREVPAGNFIFLFDPDRSDANRGISSLAHAIANVRDIVDILAYEKVGVKKDAAVGGVIKTFSGMADQGSSYIQDGFKAKDTGGLPWETIQAGMMPRLQPGEEYSSFGSNRPSPTFIGFLELLLREIAVGLGLPFEFVWDLAKAKGSGSRFILAKAQRRFEQRQQLLINRFLTRVWRWVIAKAIKRKDLPPVPYWWLVKWQAPAKITVDLGREAQANRDDLKYGNRTLQVDAGEQGLHWKDDVREQKTVEVDDLLDRAVARVEKYKAYGLTLDKALFLLSADTPNSPVLPVEQPTDGASGSGGGQPGD